MTNQAVILIVMAGYMLMIIAIGWHADPTKTLKAISWVGARWDHGYPP